jgi:hypothetical protein
MDHPIISLHFGSIEDKEELEENFGESSSLSFERSLAIPVQSSSFFLKVIPYM